MDHKVILCDIDGVVLDWHKAFKTWMEMQDYISTGVAHHDADIHLEFGINYNEALVRREEFNTNMISSALEPYADAEMYINKLFVDGYRFIGITSFSDKPIAQYYRYLNLEEYFPTDCFGTMIFVSQGDPKTEVLEQFKDTGLTYIDDRILNVNSGLQLGLKPILMSHPYNMHYDKNNVLKAKNWKQIYDHIKNLEPKIAKK